MNKRLVIYQLFVRHFGNLTETQIAHGTKDQNGCGTFEDLTLPVLKSLHQMGFNAIWLTGILEHATGTSSSKQPADHPALLKGVAGSPYAVRDAFDLCPDLFRHPENRFEVFEAFITRAHRLGIKVLIDFIPNHVARSYRSDQRPDLSFGNEDQTDRFFDLHNHFYYLQSEDSQAQLCLPRPANEDLPPYQESPARVTGNNAITWTPSLHDWYETAKLNYGHDFTLGADCRYLSSLQAVPRTWETMDEVIAHWQNLGVDGFRVDMAHLIPPPFWHWAIKRARARNQETLFIGEAYNDDPAKLSTGNILDELIAAGFNAVYDHHSYQNLEAIYEKGHWANDLDQHLIPNATQPTLLRYTENHDEVRLAHPKTWGGLPSAVGIPASAIQFLSGTGPLMVYNGQELGERSEGSPGFSGDDGRTSIFDYTHLPALQNWLKSFLEKGEENHPLRDQYAELLKLSQTSVFSHGEFYALNYAHQNEFQFGKDQNDPVAGHWAYLFARHYRPSRKTVLVLVNLSPERPLAPFLPNLDPHFRKWATLGENITLSQGGKIQATLSAEPLSYKIYDCESLG